MHEWLTSGVQMWHLLIVVVVMAGGWLVTHLAWHPVAPKPKYVPSSSEHEHWRAAVDTRLNGHSVDVKVLMDRVFKLECDLRMPEWKRWLRRKVGCK